MIRLIIGFTLILAGVRLLYLWAQRERVNRDRIFSEPCDCKVCRGELSPWQPRSRDIQ